MICKLKEQETTDAWEISRATSIPIWAARVCHMGSKWRVNTLQGWVEANDGDFIINVEIGVLCVPRGDFLKEYLVSNDNGETWCDLSD